MADEQSYVLPFTNMCVCAWVHASMPATTTTPPPPTITFIQTYRHNFCYKTVQRQGNLPMLVFCRQLYPLQNVKKNNSNVPWSLRCAIRLYSFSRHLFGVTGTNSPPYWGELPAVLILTAQESLVAEYSALSLFLPHVNARTHCTHFVCVCVYMDFVFTHSYVLVRFDTFDRY